MRHGIGWVWLGLACALMTTGAGAAEPREVRGRVVDSEGRPVAGAAVGHFWRANGSVWGKDGKAPDMTKPEDVRRFWSNVGVMEPSTRDDVRTDADGRFSVKVSANNHTLMAMDAGRRRGGLGSVPKDGGPVEVRLGPLVKVSGRIEGPKPGERPAWTHVYTKLPEDPTRPLDTDRLVSCGSFDARFEMALPPGRYVLEAYNEALDAFVTPDRAVTLSADTPEVDLGVLTLSPKPHISTRVALSKSSGAWGDYTKHYGQAPPRWHVTDARGVPKTVQAADFKGKWLLVEFWGFGCRACFSTGLPNLVRFYDEHAGRRDRFEVLAVCLDTDGEVTTLAELDRRLAPIVRHVWGGRALPFPVLLDSTFQTWERFGLPGVPTVLLIDPEGKLVEGDETVLAAKLKATEKK